MIGHYLMFNRNCAQATAVYEQAFDAKVLEMQKYGDMPANPDFPVPESDKDLVLHCRLQIDGMELMCADSTRRSTGGDNMYVSIATKDEAYVRRAWDVLKEGGEVYFDLSPSFFATLHGSLQDRFGINWMFTALR